MTNREYYSDSIEGFLKSSSDEVLGKLTAKNDFDVGQSQRDAWVEEISILQAVLSGRNGSVYFEYSIPRMGKRIDVVLLIGPIIFVIEFKAGEKIFTSSGKDQVWDYSLDLKNFHESSHDLFIAPILIPTMAKSADPVVAATAHSDKLLLPIECTTELLGNVLDEVLHFCEGSEIDSVKWEAGRYCPTPTIIEAAMALYNGHSVADISRSDASAINLTKPPIEHVALFDEAQRAWNIEQTANFMLRKKKTPGFTKSEPEFLISCLDRHPDWAVVVCLVGGGQEINTGEAGISEWVESLSRSFPDWRIFISPRLTDSEYSAGEVLESIKSRAHVTYKTELHLSVSMRSFRAENVSLLVKQLLDLEFAEAQQTLLQVNEKYPIVITRDFSKAKRWLREKARGSERYGIVVSSQAQRLKPHAIDVKSPMDPIHWFLDGKEDVRSSYYLEDVATEFHVQGLELDWACVTWDADFRYGRKKGGNIGRFAVTAGIILRNRSARII
jgi:hypothetical protein